jgi:NO-binding membrane sensor protein with MHYT domain
VLVWIAIISLTFGFCASWSLHFVGMLACKLDLLVGLDVGLTLFSAVLAVTFTFAALGAELLWDRYDSNKRKIAPNRQWNPIVTNGQESQEEDSSMPLLGEGLADGRVSGNGVDREGDIEPGRIVALDEFRHGALDPSRPVRMSESESRDSGSQQALRIGSTRLDLKSMADHGTVPTKNAFVATYEGILSGISLKALVMGLVWSLSLTCMHYGGLLAMNIPAGYLTFNPVLVVVSAIISWVVATVGYIYMVNVEPHLSQQVLVSAVTASGIAAMHFTGRVLLAI